METSESPIATRLSVVQEDYLKKEAEKLNKELEKLLEETRTREKYSITIIAGIAGWVLLKKSEDHFLNGIVSAIPMITTLLFGVSSLFLYWNIKWIGSYLSKIEKYFLDGNPYNFGWETKFDQDNKKGYFVRLTICMWLIQFALAVCLFFCIVKS